MSEQLPPTQAHPALFLSAYAQARVLWQWGPAPQALLGYSLGEYVVACLAGVLTLADGLRLVVERARLIEEVGAGAMLAVMVGEEDIAPYLSAEVWLGAVTAPATCVLSGGLAGIAESERRLAADGIATRRVETTHALHAGQMEAVRERFEVLVSGLRLAEPRVPYISNVTGTWITGEQARNPHYWGQHLCQTVRLREGIGTLLAEPDLALVEVGRGQGLSSFVKQHPACGVERFGQVVGTLPVRTQGQGDQRGMQEALGGLWMLGCEIDWQGYVRGERRQRVCLPTYPFERQRYWIDVPQGLTRPVANSTRLVSADSSPEGALSSLKMEALSDWFYLPGWKHSVSAQPFAEELAGESWLAFADAGWLGTRIITELSRHGLDVITVCPGSGFSKQNDTLYTVRPDARSDYDQLLKALSEQSKKVSRVIHLWTVTEETEPLDTVLERGFYSLLALTQALGDAGIESCHISVVTNEMQDVSGVEHVNPARSTVLGPCKVIPQEYPALSCQSIDIVLPPARSWQEGTLIEQLLGELTTHMTDPVVAFRGNRRWVPSFEALRLAEPRTTPQRIREQGVYLITGGLGGVGLALAEHLARTIHARLVLTARTALPPRTQWSAILQEQSGDTGLIRQIRNILHLEELGAEVLVFAADVANEVQMRHVVEETLEIFGALHGVLHAAGVPGIGLMQLKTAEQAARVMAPKVQGTLVLERVLEQVQLDFLVLFSSVTSITGGGPGQVDYCAANAFLDSYARQNVMRHGITLAINWGEWQWNAWEAGLAGYDQETAAFFRANRQRFGISFADGAEALQRILAGRLPQVIVSTQDFRVLADLSKIYTAATMLQKSRERQQERAVYARPTLSSEYAAPRTEVEQRIVAIWENLLGIAGVGIDDNFFDLGGNSLIGLDLIARLRKELLVTDLPGYMLFEAPTVSAMVQYIEQNKTTEAVEERFERGERRRESLKQRMMSGSRRNR